MTSGALEELLKEWLPKQRWFAGKDRGARSVRILAQRRLRDEDPTLLHVLVEVDQSLPVAPVPTPDSAAAATLVTYQVLLGVRAELPRPLDHALVGVVEGLGIVYDATHDQQLMHDVLGWISTDTEREQISFKREPGADIDPDAASLVLSAEQSNSSVVYGEQSILKLFRIVVPGTNPDLEITRALTEAGNHHVAAVQGWIEADLNGVPTTLGLLQEFLRTGSDGWALALTSVRDLFAEADLHAEEVGGDFAAESERLGMATADVHNAMAQVLETGIADAPAMEALAGSMRARLDAATTAVPLLADHAGAIADVFDALGQVSEPVRLQRVHGDYHLGQVMRTDWGWVLLDFEGEPGAPIQTRAALSSPLRDVAGMLRSFDYASRYLLADHAGVAQLEYRAAEWAERNRDAFCVGYAKAAGHDPREENLLLRAFELDKAVYEVVYEARNRPAWVSIPLGSIERLLAA
jgi:maltokinase